MVNESQTDSANAAAEVKAEADEGLAALVRRNQEIERRWAGKEVDGAAEGETTSDIDERLDHIATIISYTGPTR